MKAVSVLIDTTIQGQMAHRVQQMFGTVDALSAH